MLRDRYGVRPVSGHRESKRSTLSKHDADLLGLPRGAPGLRVGSVTRTARGVAFEHSIAHYRGDSFRCRAGRRGNAAGERAPGAYRTTRAEPPATSRLTSAKVAMEVSPGVVIARAPWATP